MNDYVNELKKADLEEWAAAMENKLEELFKHCEIYSAGVLQLHNTADCGIIIEIVKSRSGREYFVVVLLRRACISFIPVDEAESKHDHLAIGTSVVILKSMVNDIENVKVSDIFDYQEKRLVALCGFVARYIYRYNDDGKKEAQYFIGKLRITNLATDYFHYESSSEDDDPSDSDSSLSSSSTKSGDSTTDSEFSDSDADSVTSADSNDDKEEEGAEERPADDEYDEIPEGLPDEESVIYLPNIVYRRFLVPKILLDCRFREDEFYTRDNIPFVWMPGVFASKNCLNATERMQVLIPWKIPQNTICHQCENEIDIPEPNTFRGCFVDDTHIFLSLAPHSLALFSGFYDFDGENPLGRFLIIDENGFDEHLNTFIVNHADFEAANPADFEENTTTPVFFIPTENGEFECKLNEIFGLSHFYQHRCKCCYIYDRYGVIENMPIKGVKYPVKINRDYQDGKYLTVVEIYPVPEMGFKERSIEDKIESTGFVVDDQIIYCREYDYVPIYYSKEKFKLQHGTFGKIVARYDVGLQQYDLTLFILLEKIEKIAPIYTSPDKRICYEVDVEKQNGFYVNDLFGIISIKPYRLVSKKKKLIVSYVGNEPKYQTAFEENEEYAIMLKDIKDPDEAQSNYAVPSHPVCYV